MTANKKKHGVEVLEKTFTIRNKLGLHARPAAVFVQTASKFVSSVEIRKDDTNVDGKSIMGIMGLAAEMGSSITLRISGADADAALAALGKLIESDFGE